MQSQSRRKDGNRRLAGIMSNEVEMVAAMVAKECSMYTDHPMEKERFLGLAARIIAMLKVEAKAAPGTRQQSD